MIKKIILMFSMLAIISGMCLEVSAYSTNEYEIDSSYIDSEVPGESFFGSNDKFSIYITTMDAVDELDGFEYNMDFLDIASNKAMDKLKQYLLNNTKKEILKQYNNYKLSDKELELIDKQLEEYFNNSLGFSDFKKCRITKFTKNNYRCFHCVDNISINNTLMRLNIYQTESNNKIYNLIVLSAKNRSDSDIKNIEDTVNSFTIKDYNPTVLTFNDKVYMLRDNLLTSEIQDNYSIRLMIAYIMFYSIPVSIIKAIIVIIILKNSKKKLNGGFNDEKKNNSRKLEDEQNT